MLVWNVEASERPGSTGQGAPTTSASFTPPANSLLIVRQTYQFDGGSGDTTGNFTITDSAGLSWSAVNTAANLSPWSVNTKIWKAQVGASPVAMTITVNDILTFNNRFVTALDVVSFAGYNLASPIGTSEGFIDPSSGYGPAYGPWSVNLAVAPAASSALIVFLAGDDDDPFGATPGAAFTLLIDSGGSYGMVNVEVRPPGSASTVVDWVATLNGSTQAGQRCQVVVEVKAAAAIVPGTALFPLFVPGM